MLINSSDNPTLIMN